jgi:micrococcal nuclease
MLRSMRLLVTVIVLATVPAFAAYPNASTTAGPGIIHGCYDGDTCTISIPGLPSVFGDKLGLRLVGIDTPEMKGRCDEERALAKQAKAFLNARLESAQDISVEFVARDKYFRVLALILVDGLDVADAMVEAGLARNYDGTTKTGWCTDNQ